MSGIDGPVPDAVPVLPVAELGRALAFYERLGFEVRATYPGYVILGYGPTEVHLAEVPDIEGTETWTGCYLRVDDADAVHAHWVAVGAPELSAPADQPYGTREFATEDPDGNLWRVGSAIAGPDLDEFERALHEAAIDEPPPPATEVAPATTLPLSPSTSEAPGEAPADGSPGTDLDAWFALVASGGRCAGCGLVIGELHRRAIGAEVRDLAHAFGELLLAADDEAVRHRPDPTTWSALEYGVHVRDLLVVFAERIVRTLAEPNPQLGWWDHEAAIADGMANESDVGAVADDLGRNASKLSEALRMVTEDDWDRRATRRDDEVFTIELMARFTLHEVVHHQVDAERSLGVR